ncbi:hypothetical protein ACSLN1_26010, partial [Escherichia coli]
TTVIFFIDSHEIIPVFRRIGFFKTFRNQFLLSEFFLFFFCQPTEKEWDTNLFVRTTKRIYSLDLILLSEEKQAQPAYVVQFR